MANIVKINKNMVYLPKKIMYSAKLKNGDSVIIRNMTNGIVICKTNVLEDLEVAFQEFDKELTELFISKKAKELTNQQKSV